jgi:hypothetical protein
MRGYNRLICASVLLDESCAGNTAAVKELLAAGADVHHRGHHGYGRRCTRGALVEWFLCKPCHGKGGLLCRFFARHTPCACCRVSALHLALKNGHRETRLALVSAGAKLTPSNLHGLIAPRLKDLCAEYGLTTTGAKGALVARLVPKLCSEADAARYHEKMLADRQARKQIKKEAAEQATHLTPALRPCHVALCITLACSRIRCDAMHGTQ